MAETTVRCIKILGTGWIGLGSLSSAYAFGALYPLTQGESPSAAAVREGYWIFILLGLMFGASGIVNGLAILLRKPVARPTLAITSLLLLLPSIVAFFLPLLIVLPSLWLVFSRYGKDVFGKYLAKENG